MSTETLDTSLAAEALVKLKDIDDLTLALTYNNNSGAIDLTDYQFDFYLKKGTQTIHTYTIEAGELSTDYLVKMGDDVNVLNMQGMFEDARDRVTGGANHRLIQRAIHPDGRKIVHAVYQLNAGRY